MNKYITIFDLRITIQYGFLKINLMGDEDCTERVKRIKHQIFDLSNCFFAHLIFVVCGHQNSSFTVAKDYENEKLNKWI